MFHEVEHHPEEQVYPRDDEGRFVSRRHVYQNPDNSADEKGGKKKEMHINRPERRQRKQAAAPTRYSFLIFKAQHPVTVAQRRPQRIPEQPVGLRESEQGGWSSSQNFMILRSLCERK